MDQLAKPEPSAQPLGHHRMQNLSVLTATFAIGSVHSDGGRLALEIERPKCQAADFALAKARVGREDVHHGSVDTRDILYRLPS